MKIDTKIKTPITTTPLSGLKAYKKDKGKRMCNRVTWIEKLRAEYTGVIKLYRVLGREINFLQKEGESMPILTFGEFLQYVLPRNTDYIRMSKVVESW